MNKGDLIIVTTGQWKDVKGEIHSITNSLGDVPIVVVKLSNGTTAYATPQDFKVLQRSFKCPLCQSITEYRKRPKKMTKCGECKSMVEFRVVDLDDEGNEVYQREDVWKSEI